MRNKRIKAYWLLLLVFLYTACVVLSVGDAQARCANTVDWNTLVEARNDAISSNCLADADEAPLTVLVGVIPLETSSEVDFWLQANDMGSSGVLAWNVDQPDYLEVTMIIGGETIEQNAEVEVLADDEPLDISMCLEPTELAQTDVRDALDVNVTVTWGDRMSGSFRITLPEVTDKGGTDEEDETTEEEQGSSTVSDNNDNLDTDATVPEGEIFSTTENTEVAELVNEVSEANESESQDNRDAPESTTEPVTEDAEASDVETIESTGTERSTVPSTESVGAESSAVLGDVTTEPTETGPTVAPTTEPAATDPTTVPATEPAATDSNTAPTTEPEATDPTTAPASEPTASDPTTAPTTEPAASDPTTAPTTEPIEPEPTTETSTEPEKTDPSTEPTDVPDDGIIEEPIEQGNHEIQLGTIAGFDVSGLLPVKIVLTEDATSICLGLWKVDEEDDGATMHPFPDYTRISLDGGENYYVIYNGCMAAFDLSESKSLSVLLDFSNAELYAVEELMLAMKVYAQDVLMATRAVKTVPHGVQISYEASTLNSGRVTEDTGTEEPEKETAAPEVYMLTQKEPLAFILPESWTEYTLEYSIEQLTMTEENTLEYIQVDLAAGTIVAEYINNEQTHSLSLNVGDKLPRAGTYRINLKWSYEGICYAQTQTTFFINYSAFSQLLGS